MGELSVSRPSSSIEVVSYSNGGPKGLYLAEKYRVPHYTIDPVIGPKEISQLVKRNNSSAKLQLVRTNRPALASGVGSTIQQITSGGNPSNSEVINVEPVKTGAFSHPLQRIEDAHDLMHYSLMDDEWNAIPESARGRVGLIGRNALGSVVAGIAPAALAGVLVEHFTPKAPTELKIAETAGGAAGFTKVMAPLVGAGGASATAIALPMYASFEVADKTGWIVDAMIPDDLHGTIPHEVIKGVVSGASGGAGFGAMSVTQSAAATAFYSEGAAAIASAEGVEMAALGVAAAEEVGALGTAAVGAEWGAALTSELGPLAIGGAVIGGAVGLGIGLFGGGPQKPQIMDMSSTYLKGRTHRTTAQMSADGDRQTARENDMRSEEASRYQTLMRGEGGLNSKDRQFLTFLQDKKGYPK
jgi:hypothetical protein